MNRIRVTWPVVAVLSLFAPSRAIPDAYQDGLEYWNARKYNEAYSLLEQHRAREGGSPELDYMLGTAACRAGKDSYGASLLQSMLVHYHERLSAEDLEVIAAERNDCHATAVAIANAGKPPPPGVRGTYSIPSPRRLSGKEAAPPEAGPPESPSPKRKHAVPKPKGPASPSPRPLALTGTVPAGGELVLIEENKPPKATGVLRLKFSAPTAGNYSLNFCIGPRSNPCGLPTSRVVTVPGGEERLEEVNASVFKDNVLTVGQGTNTPLPYSMTIE